MNKPYVPDLSLPKMQYGTHQVPWDLRVLLHKGGAAMRRDKALRQIHENRLRPAIASRIPFITRCHEIFDAELTRGVSPNTITQRLWAFWHHVAWIDKHDKDLTIESSIPLFTEWSESLVQRVRIEKSLSPNAAYAYVRDVARTVAHANNVSHKNSGAVLLGLTRIRKPTKRKRVLGTKADKQNLDRTFRYGEFLLDVCLGISAAAVRGPLPLTIKLRDGRCFGIAGGIQKPNLDPNKIKEPFKRRRAIQARAALLPTESALDHPKRSQLFNLRICAELSIFLAQTGMNLFQAAKLKREVLRWQSDGEDMQAFRVYKGRRQGDAVFTCYKEYRTHWTKYLDWLDETGLSKEDERFFPFLYPAKIPPAHAVPSFKSIGKLTKQLKIPYVTSRQMRMTRVNWLLRRSKDPELTAEQAAHSTQTLLRHYDQPHHQTAAAEIVRYHRSTDPTFSPPGPGICTDNGRRPVAMANTPVEAPAPDCISPEGCLFCVHHRDVMTSEYCWKLTSHAKLKSLEVGLHRAPKSGSIHPADRVVERINQKLDVIKSGSAIRDQWVREARDAVRAGRYHEIWAGHIEFLELLV